MEKILVSACLLGQRVRYRGDGFAPAERLSRWHSEGRLMLLCPEVVAGLGVPRPAAEIVGGQGRAVLEREARVVTQAGADLTDVFIRGADAALALCRREGIRMAVMKARSPSCGNRQSYDGSFRGVRVSGEGVAAALLQREGIRVFNELELELAAEYLAQITSDCRR
ncbi:DUF523 domain-containing protein [Aestuariirhabdus sp. LZHN29]|uniref:DUF523 domain-containing protein n=1 Tax=Aestuariirhabdus sp. LZHN29 TaxID=3417462 RepID=UPI003CECFBB1